VALLACLIAAPVLVVMSVSHGDAWQIVGASVFAATLVTLYATSTLYHALPPSRTKRVLRVLDHIAIYLLIAGTYTPFTLGVLRGAWGWTLFGLVWGCAVLGILFKALVGVRHPRLSTVGYVVMGWLAILAIRPLMLNVPILGLVLIATGGLLYTLGVIFYATDRRVRFFHAVWHLFVLGGSVCHYFAVLWFAAPGS